MFVGTLDLVALAWTLKTGRPGRPDAGVRRTIRTLAERPW